MCKIVNVCMFAILIDESTIIKHRIIKIKNIYNNENPSEQHIRMYSCYKR